MTPEQVRKVAENLRNWTRVGIEAANDQAQRV